MPVVVKPQDGNQGRGVATNLTTPRAGRWPPTRRPCKESDDSARREIRPGPRLPRCWSWAARWWPPPAASRPTSSATASRTIRQLIDIANADPRRGEHHATVLSKIKLDAIALAVLADQGFTPDSVPPAGADGADPPQRQPEHRRHGHRRDRAGPSGGRGPGRRRRARSSAWTSPASTWWRRTSAVPLEEQGGVIVEVNAAPGPADAPGAVGRHVAARSARRSSTCCSAGRQRPHPDRRRHRRQRQDDHHAVHRPHPQGHRASAWA